MIASYQIESGDHAQLYEVHLYEERAEVSVIKSKAWGNGGYTYRQRIKPHGATWKRVLRDLKRYAQPGSLAAEQLAGCADTVEEG